MVGSTSLCRGASRIPLPARSAEVVALDVGGEVDGAMGVVDVDRAVGADGDQGQDGAGGAGCEVEVGAGRGCTAVGVSGEPGAGAGGDAGEVDQDGVGVGGDVVCAGDLDDQSGSGSQGCFGGAGGITGVQDPGRADGDVR